MADIEEILCGVEWSSLYQEVPTANGLDARIEEVTGILAEPKTPLEYSPSLRESRLAARLLGDPPGA